MADEETTFCESVRMDAAASTGEVSDDETVSGKVLKAEDSDKPSGCSVQDQDPQAKAQELEDTLRANPSFIEPVRALLSVCAEARQEEVRLLEGMQQRLQQAGLLPVEPLSSIVHMLVEHGAFVETVEVNGRPYAGTIEDAFNDESISEEDEALIYEQITAAGAIVLADLDPKKRTYEVFQSHPHLADALLRTLELCDREGGLKTKELEGLLDKEGYLYRDERTNIPHIYPSLYGNLLTDVGAMKWEHAWITTDLGREVERELTRAA